MLMRLCSSPPSLLSFRLVLVSIDEVAKQPRLILLDVIPTPKSNFPNSLPVFQTANEHRMARQPLDYLSEELSKSQGQSSIAQRSKHDLIAYLNPAIITDL